MPGTLFGKNVGNWPSGDGVSASTVTTVGAAPAIDAIERPATASEAAIARRVNTEVEVMILSSRGMVSQGG
jgi:hypothetical protein